MKADSAVKTLVLVLTILCIAASAWAQFAPPQLMQPQLPPPTPLQQMLTPPTLEPTIKVLPPPPVPVETLPPAAATPAL